MGIVVMGVGGSYRFEGSQITQTAGCLYCDRCGSFNIGKRITLKALLAVLIAALVVTLLVNSVDHLPGAWPACFGVLLLFVSMTGVFTLGHRCKKCGNMHISMDNVLNYPENDRSILDIPYEAAIKYYMDDY